MNASARGGTQRIFVAVDPPVPVREEIATTVARIRDDPALAETGVRWVRPTQIHLTLAFIPAADPAGISDIARAIRGVATPVAPFQVELGGAGTFPGLRNPSVLWLGVRCGSDSLAKLASSLGAALEKVGYPQPERTFRPHVTLARLRRPRDIGGLVSDLNCCEFSRFIAGDLYLYESHLGDGPARYSQLDVFPLGQTCL